MTRMAIRSKGLFLRNENDKGHNNGFQAIGAKARLSLNPDVRPERKEDIWQN